MDGTTLTAAANQWASRPADERFDSLEALYAATAAQKKQSTVMTAPLAKLTAVGQGRDLIVAGPNGGGARPTHHAFGQLCSRIGAPAGYLRGLSAETAALAMNEGLRALPADDTGAIMLRENGARTMRCVVSEKYARLWNADVAKHLLELQAQQPSWVFPTAFRHAGGGVKANAWGASKELPVAFASDHDLFVFLCDYDHGVEITQGDGSKHTLARGFFVENSEVGAGKWRLTAFLFDFVCSNVLVWGARDVFAIERRHVGAVERVAFTGLAESAARWVNASPHDDARAIVKAQKTLIADTTSEVAAELFKRYGKQGLTQTTIDATIIAAEETPRYGDPRSIWGVTQGLTEVSQREGFTDRRVQLDRIAGDIMSRAF